jgi:hypothetical protein
VKNPIFGVVGNINWLYFPKGQPTGIFTLRTYGDGSEILQLKVCLNQKSSAGA